MLKVPRPSVLKKTPLKAFKSGIGGRIVGGQDAEKGEFPWQISYQFDLGDGVAFHSCGGSILNENKIGIFFDHIHISKIDFLDKTF